MLTVLYLMQKTKKAVTKWQIYYTIFWLKDIVCIEWKDQRDIIHKLIAYTRKLYYVPTAF